MHLCAEEMCSFVFLLDLARVYVTRCCLCCLTNAISGESIVLVVSSLKALMADTALFSDVSTTHLAPHLGLCLGCGNTVSHCSHSVNRDP